MHGSAADLAAVSAIADGARRNAGVDVALCLPATLIERAARAVPGFAIGGQDVHAQAKGAHTGDIAAAMLADSGAALTIVGHSERRADHHESDETVRAKARSGAGRRASTSSCASARASPCASAATPSRSSPPSSPPRCPTGRAMRGGWRSPTSRSGRSAPAWFRRSTTFARCTPRFARSLAASLRRAAARESRILYGGSVKASNAAEILGLADVDGALVGGASLTAADFLPIVEAASSRDSAARAIELRGPRVYLAGPCSPSCSSSRR